MSFGANTSSTNAKTTYTPNPATTQFYDPTFQQASSDFNQPVQAYSGELYPGMTAAQTEAGSLVAGDLGLGSQPVSDAIGAVQGLTNVQAPQVQAPTVQGANLGPAAQAGSTGYSASLIDPTGAGAAALTAGAAIDPSMLQQVSSQSLPSTDLSAYMNPYLSSVIDPALQQMEQQRQQAIAQTQGQATQAGAFGGSREGVADAQTNQYWGQLEAQEIGNLENSGYQQATANAESDAARGLQAGEANQSTALSAGATDAGLLAGANASNASNLNAMAEFNANQGLQGLLADQSAGDAAAQFGAGAANTADLSNAAQANAMAQALAGYQEQTGLAQAGYDMGAQTANQNAYLSSAGLDLNAASQLGQLGQLQQTMGLTGANALNAYGTEQQQTQAAQDQASYQDFLREMSQYLDEGQGNLGLLGSLAQLYAGATTNQKSNTTQGGFGFSLAPSSSGGMNFLPLAAAAL